MRFPHHWVWPCRVFCWTWHKSTSLHAVRVFSFCSWLISLHYSTCYATCRWDAPGLVSVCMHEIERQDSLRDKCLLLWHTGQAHYCVVCVFSHEPSKVNLDNWHVFKPHYYPVRVSSIGTSCKYQEAKGSHSNDLCYCLPPVRNMLVR